MNIDWVTILTIGLPILSGFLIYLLQINKKKLSYEILQNRLMMSNRQKAIDDIKIIYKNQEVKNISIVEIAFINNGNKSIEKSDFENDIEIYLENNIILSSEVIHTLPEALKVNLSHDDKSVKILPVLLNRNDLFILRLILKDSTLVKLKVGGRIKEVKDILSNSENKIPKRIIISGVLLSLGGVILGGILGNHPKPQVVEMNGYDFLAISIMILGIIIGFYGLFINTKFKRIIY